MLIVLAGQAQAQQQPRDVEVPAALAAVTSPLELSGITWLEPQHRYLLVSDDTGLKERKTYHLPILFSARSLLSIDAEPVPIAGIDRLDDAESLTPGPQGTLLVCTSHSPDREGKSKPARRQLLWLAPAQAGFEVKRALDLSEVRDEKGRGLAELVSGRPGAVDIEGSEFHDGALYLGFKAPLADDGAAAIVKLGQIIEALEQGKVDPKAVTVFARPRLEVAGPGDDRVFEGIADLRFLPGGGLVLLANSPKGARPDGGGAAWWLQKPDAAPKLLRRFEALKPEGVTVTADGSQLVIVFDRGKEQPRWLALPLPH